MAKKKKPDHLHRYKRINLSKKGIDPYWVYKCVKPGCSHYIPTALSEGQICECNKCYEPMVITKVVLKGYKNNPLVRPHCPECSKTKAFKQVDIITAFLDSKG